MDRQQAIQEIRSRIRCSEYLTKSKNGLYCCPFCGSGTGPHGTGALKVYDTNTWTCHACNKSGDVIDLYREATGADFAEAVDKLAQIAGIDIDRKFNSGAAPRTSFNGNRGTNAPQEPKAPEKGLKTPQEESPDYTAYYEACKKMLDSPEGAAGIAYLDQRQVRAAALQCGVGFDPQADPASAPGAIGEAYKPHPCPRIIIPCGKSFYMGRSINGGYAEKANTPTKVNFFNGEKLFAPEVQEVFITEGAFDALSVMEAGGEALGLNGTPQIKKLVQRLGERKPSATLIIALDNDNAGHKATAALAEDLTRLKIPFITADICNGLKDPNEALTADYPAFEAAVWGAMEDAKALREKLRQEAQQEERERMERTGAGMIDAFLETVRTRKYEPIPTGIADIDAALTGGFTRQTLILLGAAPGAGKTALAQWIFEGMAQRGTSCLFLNLEMSREQILARSIARIAARRGEHITPAEVKQGYKWDVAQEAIVMAAAQEYKETIAPRMIYNPLDTTTDLDAILQYMEEEAQRAEAAGLPAPLVVIDYLQIITGNAREDEVSLIKRAVSSLKHFAMKHNTVVFCIMAHNRAANQSGNVSMASGRDTSALEYSADLQLGLAFTECLDRDGGKGKDFDALTPEERQRVTLKITKGRDAKIGAEVDLIFNGETMTYTPIDKRREDPMQTWAAAPTMKI